MAIGVIQMPVMTWGNTSIAKDDMAHGTALLTSLRNLAGALGVVIFVALLDSFGVAISYGAMAVCSLAVLACAKK